MQLEVETITFASGEVFHVRQLSAREYYQVHETKDLSGHEQTYRLVAAAVRRPDGSQAFSVDEVQELPLSIFGLFSEVVFRLNQLDLDDIKKKYGITSGSLSCALP